MERRGAGAPKRRSSSSSCTSSSSSAAIRLRRLSYIAAASTGEGSPRFFGFVPFVVRTGGGTAACCPLTAVCAVLVAGAESAAGAGAGGAGPAGDGFTDAGAGAAGLSASGGAEPFIARRRVQAAKGRQQRESSVQVGWNARAETWRRREERVAIADSPSFCPPMSVNCPFRIAASSGALSPSGLWWTTGKRCLVLG
jgi:hypothetical protein